MNTYPISVKEALLSDAEKKGSVAVTTKNRMSEGKVREQAQASRGREQGRDGELAGGSLRLRPNEPGHALNTERYA